MSSAWSRSRSGARRRAPRARRRARRSRPQARSASIRRSSATRRSSSRRAAAGRRTSPSATSASASPLPERERLAQLLRRRLGAGRSRARGRPSVASRSKRCRSSASRSTRTGSPGSRVSTSVAAERLAELRDVALEDVRRRSRWVVAPERVDQARRRHDVARVEQEHGEHGARPRSQARRAAVDHAPRRGRARGTPSSRGDRTTLARASRARFSEPPAAHSARADRGSRRRGTGPRHGRGGTMMRMLGRLAVMAVSARRARTRLARGGRRGPDGAQASRGTQTIVNEQKGLSRDARQPRRRLEHHGVQGSQYAAAPTASSSGAARSASPAATTPNATASATPASRRERSASRSSTGRSTSRAPRRSIKGQCVHPVVGGTGGFARRRA